MHGKKIRETSNVTSYYSLDLAAMRSKLANAQETGRNAKAVEITLPTLNGKMEKFAVYSFPVVVKSIADRYDLGSYVGVGIDDPQKYVRFSVAPNDFQSMIIKGGEYQFIEPQNTDKTVYGVHAKTKKGEGGDFLCSTNEAPMSKAEIAKLLDAGKSITNNPADFSRNSDKKYRTMRLAMSVTGEYTVYFGGVPGALAAINATLTRCNGVFEKDFALHLNLQDFPQLIYTDPATDPYSAATAGAGGAWNLELQKTLTSVVGEANYDIGHLFGASGGGGNAGCIGCVCISPSVDANGVATSKAKGSAFTSPADGKPFGDNFDIDYVAHEMGHQLGANHTFSHGIEGTGVNVEPGSGSTIMGYAGITAADVQPHSDAYFHAASIGQVQTNLIAKTCDIETNIVNNPPVIAALTDYTIPKGTAFVLTASATDPENDPITYTWEEMDNASTAVTTVTGNNTTGALFRSLSPTTNPTRYFPKFASVMAGNLTVPADWETVSNVARVTSFRVTVRDNNANVAEQQTQFANQKITVGAVGPFKVESSKVYNNATAPLTWTKGTDVAPYNVANVKIDYTKDNGATWTVLAESTPNDGSEVFDWSSVPTNTNIKVRITALGNVFYAVNPVVVSMMAACNGTAPTSLQVSGATVSGAVVNWDAFAGATYIVRYKKTTDTTWTEVPVNTNTYTLTDLQEDTSYEVQVAAVCSGTTGAYTASANFKTLPSVSYCTMTSSNSNDEYINNVTVTPDGGGVKMSNSSGASNYTDYTADATKVIVLAKGSTDNKISVGKGWRSSSYNEAVNVWIDFNRNGTFESTEMVMAAAPDKTTPVTTTFSVPSSAYTGDKTVRMRVVLKYNSAATSACGTISYGEIEDYAVKIIAAPFKLTSPENNATNVGPNPITITWDPVPNATAYKVYIGTTSGGAEVVNGDTVAAKAPQATSYTVNLNPSTKYYTRVEAVIPTGNLVSSEVNFTTAAVLATVDGAKTSMTVYPNPATDILNVTKVSDKANYQIFDMAGQVVSKGKVTDNKVPVSKLEKGVYVISVEENGNATKLKFIKK